MGMAGISVVIPGMDGMELSRLTNGVANLTVVLQQVIPELTRSFVRTLDTVTNVIRPLGNVTKDLAEISDQSKPSILHLQKMTEGTVKLLDTLNQGLTPMQDISLGLTDLLESTKQTMKMATMAIVLLAVLAIGICFALFGIGGVYYAKCYEKETSETEKSKQVVEYVQDKI